MSAPALAYSGRESASASGMGETFVGTALLAASTAPQPRCSGSIDPSQAVAGIGAILLMALALAAIVHGTETRAQRLEPDAILLLVTDAGALFAVWSVRP